MIQLLQLYSLKFQVCSFVIKKTCIKKKLLLTILSHLKVETHHESNSNSVVPIKRTWPKALLWSATQGTFMFINCFWMYVKMYIKVLRGVFTLHCCTINEWILFVFCFLNNTSEEIIACNEMLLIVIVFFGDTLKLNYPFAK